MLIPILLVAAFGAGALLARRKRPLSEMPPWMIEELRKREQRDDRPRIYLPSPPPPPPEEEEPVVIDIGEDE